ncbi:MAG TPA: Gfo/Idh/MocA family oxidoreductase [Galbitalea sp.]|jgi:predicted dehydrogenase|nr:Gfo/Idh/MocA family oxidoreductase [Galbitalea sp.]
MTGILGVVIVGCGAISYNHADAIARVAELRIVALVDVDAASARSLAEHIDGQGGDRPAVHSSLSDALAAGGIDLVVICTPSGLHVSLADEAIAAGKHVVIEKPLDVSLPRARRIAELAETAASNDLVVSVISQHRFDPASVVVHDAATSGGFGRLTSGIASIAWWRDQAYYDSAAWRGTWELDGGGAAMNQGVHTIDLLLWMFGEPVDVNARTAALAHDRIEVEDTLVSTITFASGALGLIHATTAAHPNVGTRLQVHGSEGSAVIEEDQLLFFSGTASDQEGNQAAAMVPADDVRGNPRPDDSFVIGHLRQYRDIVAAIREHRAPGVRVEDALLALAVIRALYLSATLERTVTVAEVLDGSLDDVEVRTGGAA